MTQQVGSSNHNLLLCQIWRLWVLQKCSYKVFQLSCKTSHDLVSGVPHRRLPLCQVWWSQVLQKCTYVFHLSPDHMIKLSHEQKITSLSGWGLLAVSYHSAKYGGHRYCGSADMFFNLLCDHLIKRSQNNLFA